jgi:predicted naringenin-chalcone synthase
MTFAIRGIGTAVPETIVTQDEALRIAQALACPTDEQATWLPGMYHQTGIVTRNLVFSPELVRDALENTQFSKSIFLPTGNPTDRGPTTGQRLQCYAQQAPPLAIGASQAALASGHVAADLITHLITVSCTGFFAPGVDHALMVSLGLSPQVQRTHIGFMGCHGALNAIRVARAFTGSDPDARVLLCAVELCCLHYHYSWNPAKMIANALFADGAAALVGMHADAASQGEWQAAASGSCLIPRSANAMTWTIADHGFEMTLGKDVPGLIARQLRPWLEGWLAQHDIALEQVGSWAIHPGGPKIITAVEEGLSLPAGATAGTRAIFAAHGNMSSPTILFILDRLRREGAPRPCVALAFGPGLVVEATLFR